MKGLLCFNGPVIQDREGAYYSNLLSPEFLEKYFQICSHLVIVSRIRSVPECMKGKGLHYVDTKAVTLIASPDYTSPIQVVKNQKRLDTILFDAMKDVDIVFVRVSGSIAIRATKMAKKRNIPCLVEAVTCARDVYWNHSLKGKLAMPFMYHQMRKVIYHADYVQYITNEFMQSRYPTKGKSYICSNALTEPMSEKELQECLSRYDADISSRRIHIATTATLSVAYKGQEDVILAVRKMVDQGYDLVYHLIGGGDQSRLKNIAHQYGVEDRVIFVGSLLHTEVLKYLNQVDLYIQPSWAEAQGRSLIEALSRGLPCICSNVGGMVELVQPMFVYQKHNVKDLTMVLKRLIASDLKEVSMQNYLKSLEFDKEKLILKRKEIFFDIAHSIEGKEGEPYIY